jgi:hypothetical protein
MSTIKVNKIENTATADGGVAIDVDGHVTVDGQQLPTAGPLSNRNLIINGAMQVAQRSTSETGLTSGGYHTIDRFRISQVSNGAGTFNLDQSTDVPANQGFANSFKVECTTPSGNPYPDADAVFLDQRIEAQNLQHLKYGTANAEDVTVSFWAKASEGGAYCLSIHQDDPNKSYVKEYTLEAGVWKYVSLTFPGNTADVITNDNGVGFIVAWGLAAGADNQMSADTWATPPNSGGNVTTANQNQLFDTAGAEFYLTGVQLEVGSKATPFEHRSYADELHRCRRYYFDLFYGAGSTALTLPMRADGNNNREAFFMHSPAIRIDDADLSVTLSSGTLNVNSRANPYFTRVLVNGSNDTDVINMSALTVDAEL